MTSFELMQALCNHRETGMLFAVTRDGRQLRVGFLNGAIVHVAYALRAGAEALSRARRTRAVSCSFSRGLVSTHDPDLPDREVLLEYFAPILADGTVTAVAERMAVSGAPNGTDPTRAANPLEQLRAMALEYLGPMGSVLLDEECARGAPPWNTLVARLADQIASPNAAEAFRRAALQIAQA